MRRRATEIFDARRERDEFLFTPKQALNSS
jgi:hypothetical protein